MARQVTDRMARLVAQKQAAVERAKALDAQLRKLRSEQDRMARIAARKARNHALVQTGALVEIAGLLHSDRGTLLGGLMALAENVNGDPERARQWKQAGDAELARRETGKTKKADASAPV